MTRVMERIDSAIAIRADGSEQPLFLIHEDAGSVSYAHVLASHLRSGIPVYALPGIAQTEPPLRTIEGMAARLVRMIRVVQWPGPYRIAGWSFGGTLAYEVATQLLGLDECVEFLGILDTACVDDRQTGFAGPVHDQRTLQLMYRDAARRYLPQRLRIPVHLFAARETPAPDPLRGWGRVLPESSICFVPVPGACDSMMSGSNVVELGARLSRAIRPGGQSAPPPALHDSARVPLRFGQSGVAPLFCIPGAGASVTSFTDFASALDAAQPVYGLQPRGLDGAMAPHASVAAAAQANLPACREMPAARPIHLLGHSFGGWVAFEMALCLRAEDRRIGSLTIVDSDAPHADATHARECDAVEAFEQLVEAIELSTGRSLDIDLASAAATHHAARMELLHEHMVRRNLMPRQSLADVLEGPYRVFASCLRTSYQPAAVYPDPLGLVLVRDDRLSEQANRDQLACRIDAWRRCAPRLHVIDAPGNHHTVLRKPFVSELASYFSRASAEQPGER
jgi:thioesterase domain-containing protein